MLSRRNIILGTLVLIILGALLGRDFPRAGLIVSVVAVGAYVALGAQAAVRRLRRWRSSDGRERLRAVVPVVLTLCVVSALVSGSMSYFIILVLLAADYILYAR